jgi:hypothetical protein
MKAARLGQEQTAIRSNCFMSVHEMLKHGNRDSWGMRTFHRLLQLLRSADQHDAARGFRDRDRIGQ